MTEGELQAECQNLADRLGIWWYHEPDSRRSRGGLPDLILAGWSGVIFRELKDNYSQTTTAQRMVGYRFQAAGLDWDVWRPRDLESGRIKREMEYIAQ